MALERPNPGVLRELLVPCLPCCVFSAWILFLMTFPQEQESASEVNFWKQETVIRRSINLRSNEPLDYKEQLFVNRRQTLAPDESSDSSRQHT